MISFGELRRKSVEWQTDLDTVEKIYARDWLLKGVFDRPALRGHLALRGPSALASAYFPEYMRVKDIDLTRARPLDDATLERELQAASTDAAQASGLQFRLNRFKPSEVRFEFTGPLGRRSAAQPLIVARIFAVPPLVEPMTRPLIHPFGDTLDAAVRAVALSELAAERIVMFAQKPRARDLYDLWFILSRTSADSVITNCRELARTIAAARRVTLRPTLDPNHAPLLERTWDRALQEIRNRPSFGQAQADISRHLQIWLADPESNLPL